MIYFYFLIITGVFFVFFGSVKLISTLERMHRQLSQFEQLSETTTYADLQALRYELDELNYSYYELLADLTDRLEVAETKIQRLLDAGITVEQLNTEKIKSPSELIESGAEVSAIKPIEDERLRVVRLINQGFSDADIARILQIGTGKVALLRKLEEHKK